MVLSFLQETAGTDSVLEESQRGDALEGVVRASAGSWPAWPLFFRGEDGCGAILSGVGGSLDLRTHRWLRAGPPETWARGYLCARQRAPSRDVNPVVPSVPWSITSQT